MEQDSLFADLYWVAGAILVLAIVFYLTRRHQFKQRAMQEKPPYQKVVNDTNYNIDNRGLNEEQNYDNLTPEQARTIKKGWEETDYIPSEEEYAAVDKALKG